MKKRKFYIQLFIANSLIVFLFVSIASSLFFYKSNEIGQITLDNSHQAFLNESRNNIDTQLSIVLNITNQLKLNSKLIEYANEKERNYYSVVQVYNELRKSLNGFSNFGFTMAVAKPGDNLVITPASTNTTERLYQEIGLTKSDIREIDSYTAKGFSYQPLFFKQSSDATKKKRITFIKKEPGLDLIFFISFYNYYLFPQIDIDTESFGLMMEDRLIGSRTNQGQEFEKLLTDADIDENNGYKINSIDSKTIPGLKYVHVVKKNSYFNRATGHMLKAFYVYLLLSVIGLIVVILAAKWTYHPINKLVNRFKKYSESEEKDEFLFIQNAADQISQTNLNLRHVISNNRLPLKQKFMRDLLYGVVPQERVKEEIRGHELSILKGPFRVVIIQFGRNHVFEEDYSKQNFLDITSNSTTLIQKKLIKATMHCEVVDLEINRYALLLNEKDHSKLKELLTSILSRIEIDFGIQAMAAVGRKVETIGEIDHFFNEVSNMVDSYQIMDRRKTVISVEDFEHLKYENFYYPLDLERDLISNVISNNSEKALKMLNQMLNENLLVRSLRRETVSQFIIAIVATINRIRQQVNHSNQDSMMHSEKLYSNLVVYHDHEELKQKIIHLYTDIIDLINEKNTEHDQDITVQMTNFIQQRYDEDLSLTDLAEHFNFSPSYISTLFKNYIGQNFKDYLNTYRVIKAKEILTEQKDIKIATLAKMVGCNNTNTFIRIFKKYEGMSPGQYSQKIS